MKLSTAYIISYLPDDAKVRKKRKLVNERQLRYWASKNLNIVVFAQNYSESDFSNIQCVEYIVNESSNILLPGSARNVLLERFYSSDDDFCIIMDDDIILYEGEKYRDSDSIVDILRKVPIARFLGIDVFAPLNPTRSAFTKFYSDEKEILDSNLWFKRTVNGATGGMLFFRNFKKFENKKFFYSDWKNEDGSLKMGEDIGFIIDLTRQYKGVYTLQNIVRNDMGWNYSSWSKENSSRKSAMKQMNDAFLKEGIFRKKNGDFDWAGFVANFNPVRKIMVKK